MGRKGKRFIPRTSKHIGRIARGMYNPSPSDMEHNGCTPFDLGMSLRGKGKSRAERRADGQRGKKGTGGN